MVGLLIRVVVRNLVAWILIVAGIVLSLPGVPGPGSVIVLVGLALADWPFKIRFFNWLRRFRWFQKAADWSERRLRFRFPGENPHDVSSEETQSK